MTFHTDDDAPEAPSVTIGAITDHTVKFSWTVPDENGSPIDYYQYRLYTSAGATVGGQDWRRMCGNGYSYSSCSNNYAGIGANALEFTVVDTVLQGTTRSYSIKVPHALQTQVLTVARGITEKS